jgi:CRISPR/Cas system-associated exonuclease Cas4 (RecB family)
MFYQLRGVEVTADMLSANDFSSIRMGEVGTDAHERIQTYLIDMSNDESFNSTWQYYDVEQYIKMFHLEDNLQVISKNGLEYKIFNKQYNIRFQTDGLLFNKVTKKFYVFEFKTETDMKFGKRNAVNEDHYNQGICYCLSFQIDTGVIFLYEGRDFLGHKAYYLEVTEQMKKGLTDIIHTVNDFIDRDELPPMCEKLKICRYCDYKKYCSVNSKGVREKE